MATAGYKTGMRSENTIYVYYRTANTIEHPDYNVNKADQSDYSSDGLDGVLQASLDAYGDDGMTYVTASSIHSVMNYNPLTDNWEQVPGQYIL